jgi:hypothetical protein
MKGDFFVVERTLWTNLPRPKSAGVASEKDEKLPVGELQYTAISLIASSHRILRQSSLNHCGALKRPDAALMQASVHGGDVNSTIVSRSMDHSEIWIGSSAPI